MSMLPKGSLPDKELSWLVSTAWNTGLHHARFARCGLPTATGRLSRKGPCVWLHVSARFLASSVSHCWPASVCCLLRPLPFAVTNSSNPTDTLHVSCCVPNPAASCTGV